MFGLGFGELVLLAVIALLVFGPDQLPIVARNVARFLNELKRTTDEFKKELKVDEELSSTFNEIKQLRTKNLLEGLTENKDQKNPPKQVPVDSESETEAAPKLDEHKGTDHNE